MPKINCAKCKKEYEIDFRLEGKKVKCSKCENIFVINFGENEEKVNNEIKDKKETNNNIIKKKDATIEQKINNTNEKVIKMEEDNHIKPKKISYILLGSPVLIFAIIAIINTFINPYAGIFFFVITFFIYIWYNIKYKKEEYIITDRKIIFNYGNLFSDNSVEINLDKVTQVSSILGFLQYKIFGTGNLLIKTAGSDTSKVNLKHISSTMDIYENFQVRMQKNGFHLQKNKLVQTVKPHGLGIVGEIVGKIFVNFIVIVIFLGSIISEIASSSLGIDSMTSIIFIIVTLTIVTFSYLDLKRRKYEIYTDSIFYTEGFLTKNFSFLPMESVADTENTQSFFSKIFGLHDVVVSSEGSNNNVLFKNMLNGEQMMKNIKYLKNNIIMKEKDILEGEEKSVNSLIGFKDKIDKPLDYDKDFKAEYSMSMLKSIVLTSPFLILGLFIYPFFVLVGVMLIILFFVLLIIQIIRVKFTKFIVEESSIEKKFEFLGKEHSSFSIEKITGVIIKQSILDKILGTCSISFWSIGSSSSIKFADIKKTDDLEKNILAKVGIKIDKDKKDIKIIFNLMNYIKSSISFFIIFVLFTISLIIIFLLNSGIGLPVILGIRLYVIVLFFIVYLYKIFYYKKTRYIQRVADDFIESISGILFVKKYYILLRNIKGIKSVKYPLTETGTLVFDVSGEQITKSNGKNGFSFISNTIKIPFVGDVFNTHYSFDNILNEEKIDKTILATSKQDIGNSIVFYVIFTLIIVTIFMFLDPRFSILILILASIIIGIIVWSIKVIYFNFEKDRVLYNSGIIYKRKHTILYNKFNFIEKNQGFINKIFKNGIVKIYTLGSGNVEMKLKDIDNFKEIYELLKKD